MAMFEITTWFRPLEYLILLAANNVYLPLWLGVSLLCVVGATILSALACELLFEQQLPKAGWLILGLAVDAPLQARENVGVVAARGRMLSSVRPWMRHDDSRRPVWEFADRVQITRSVLEAQW